jgi:4-diphosphocytidyl-2-C-methyl-D-erythritol kinase
LVRAPAKINLGLVVGERGPDRLRDLMTVFSRINLYDEVRLTARRLGPGRRRSIRLSIASSLDTDLPRRYRNSCIGTAELFLVVVGIKRVGIDLHLTKRVPFGVGLGSRASVGAAVLIALNRQLDRPFSVAKLHFLASVLDSEMPFFLYPGAARGVGPGDILEPIEIPKLQLLLYTPDFQVDAAWADKELDRLRASGRSWQDELTAQCFSLNRDISRLKAGDLSAPGLSLPNSFEEVVFRFHPELVRVKERLLAAGAAAVSLSGTGGALYAIVAPGQRARIRRELKREGIGLTPVETVPGAEPGRRRSSLLPSSRQEVKAKVAVEAQPVRIVSDER